MRRLTDLENHSICIVIMGAAVWPGGRPSGAMQRRVEAAIRYAATLPHPCFLPTGGQGKYGPPEAEVMRSLLLDAGIPSTQIMVEATSHDTLSSVLACSRILKDAGISTAILCTDRYHIPRCRWLFRRMGITMRAAPIPSGIRATGTAKWLYYYIREFAATVWDTILIARQKV